MYKIRFALLLYFWTPQCFCRLQRHGLPVHVEEEEVRQVGQRWWRFVRQPTNNAAVFLLVISFSLCNQSTINSHQPIFLCNRHQLDPLRTRLGRPQAPRQAWRARPQRREAGEFFIQYFCRSYFLFLSGRNLFQESFIIKLMERNSNICQYSTRHLYIYLG